MVTEVPEIDIEALLVWVYQRQRADLVVDRGVGLHELEREAAGIPVTRRTADGTGSSIAVLGCRVDNSGTPSGVLHPDAEAVHDAVCRAPRPLWTGLLIEVGRTGERPDWLPGARVEEQAILHRGKVVFVVDDDGCIVGPKVRTVLVRDEVGPDGRVRQVTLDRSPAALELGRRVYAEWRAALAWLVDELVSRQLLASHRVTGPAAPDEPWVSVL
ncbi:hypothetical protein [Nitrospirillum viridazoti]|uniref:Uncharacterized protein n=1 Tax=Nitrospirillum viridazoti CBAmc TaxID=1441467 RepID=A0A248JS13_9PROT|nr:hypothetical protein [Nitrospirillum amazonense]ASG21399.1 hypothetical protein Y958_11595 [Nitrospirillum amazonense CBAmc]TWB33076.1 hypothetical protein FBZ91_115138 [Nitrospirillum amazonense]